ncbi:hypothetical protein ABZ456_25895 [Streptomyces sp. NPDC005776]|uniref:hypothetical protein n=1 Tax=Streptomyces sp. NPDC005776 TaxID=3154676 RepID=UPI0033CC385B
MNVYMGQSALVQAAWVRSLRQPKLFAVGRYWDVIRVEADIGVPAVRVLEAAYAPVGPVLHDHGNGQTYFLTPPGTARTWQRERTRALGPGSWIVLAPAEWNGLLRWVSGPCNGPAFTEADELVNALTVATLWRSTEEADR